MAAIPLPLLQAMDILERVMIEPPHVCSILEVDGENCRYRMNLCWGRQPPEFVGKYKVDICTWDDRAIQIGVREVNDQTGDRSRVISHGEIGALSDKVHQRVAELFKESLGMMEDEDD